jgi:hypothetical protein
MLITRDLPEAELKLVLRRSKKLIWQNFIVKSIN